MYLCYTARRAHTMRCENHLWRRLSRLIFFAYDYACTAQWGGSPSTEIFLMTSSLRTLMLVLLPWSRSSLRPYLQSLRPTSARPFPSCAVSGYVYVLNIPHSPLAYGSCVRPFITAPPRLLLTAMSSIACCSFALALCKAAPLAALAFLIAFDPLLRLLPSTLSTQGAVQACADDVGLVLNSHEMLRPVSRVFRLCKFLANLDLTFLYCALVPLVPDHLGATVHLKAWLSSHVPPWRDLPLDTSAPYLGLHIGPHAASRYWVKPSRAWLSRVREIFGTPAPLSVSASLYNRFAVPTLGHVAQLALPPPSCSLESRTRSPASSTPLPLRSPLPPPSTSPFGMGGGGRPPHQCESLHPRRPHPGCHPYHHHLARGALLPLLYGLSLPPPLLGLHGSLLPPPSGWATPTLSPCTTPLAALYPQRFPIWPLRPPRGSALHSGSRSTASPHRCARICSSSSRRRYPSVHTPRRERAHRVCCTRAAGPAPVPLPARVL